MGRTSVGDFVGLAVGDSVASVGDVDGRALGEADGLIVGSSTLAAANAALQAIWLPLDRALLPPTGQLAPHSTADAAGHADTWAL